MEFSGTTEDCKNCSGRGHHVTEVKTIHPNGTISIVRTRKDCKVCDGEGFIIKEKD